MHPDENNRPKKLKGSVPKGVGWGTAAEHLEVSGASLTGL
jgi:hypothetical protein